MSLAEMAGRKERGVTAQYSSWDGSIDICDGRNYQVIYDNYGESLVISASVWSPGGGRRTDEGTSEVVAR